MTETKAAAKKRFIKNLQDAAAKAVAEDDPWGKYEMERIPAERVVRHLYHPETKTWSTDESIVKCQKEPFTNGAMRFCYRLKKRSPPPTSASNHRFHNYGWTRASNYVAKAYQTPDGQVDTSLEAKEAVRNDITLQYEAQYWAERFNRHDPPKSIHFIRAYAMEFPDRPGSPFFAVERYISGKDSYGGGFTKHNTNSGFVDEEQHRVTPQVFSAFSFYESKGDCLVADIQGVGDLYTDPQVLSSQYRFGEGDLGPRGMALFFKTFRHNTLADSMGIPVFPLSRKELKHQAKYEDDDTDDVRISAALSDEAMNKFQAMDINRKQRMASVLTMTKKDGSSGEKDTAKRSNMKDVDMRASLRASMRLSTKRVYARTDSEVDEVQSCLKLANRDFLFSHTSFNRKESGELMSSKIKRGAGGVRSSLQIRRVSDPMIISNQTKLNLGKVHYQLALLHGMGRFPEMAEDGSPCAFSVLFHLCYAASFQYVAGCLALGRLQAGLTTFVSPLLSTIVPVDFDAAKDILRRAMESPYPPAAPKAAAGCLLYQIYQGEVENNEIISPANDSMVTLLQDILALMDESSKEQTEMQANKKISASIEFEVGDRVEANFAMEGTFYPGIVESISESGISVKYDDDGSTETLTKDNVRPIIPATATATAVVSDDEALGTENTDEKCILEAYELKAELADLTSASNNQAAAVLYEEASTGAMEAGKMKKATEWSLKAAELMN